jgi:hypothetical protein
VIRRRQPVEVSTQVSPLRGALDELGNGHTVTVSFDLEGQGEELVQALRQITQQVSPVSAYRLRIASHVVTTEPGGVLLDALASSSPSTRRAAAEACGLLQIEVAVPALGFLLVDSVRRVRRAAAEALGRIGGHRAADQLIRGLRSRRLPVSWLLLGLVRAAPDHYLESRLAEERDPRTLPWLALAAGIRRSRVTRTRLAELLASPDQRTRAWACRALGWIGDPEDAILLRAVFISDEDENVREAAARGLRRFHDPEAAALLESIAAARRPRVLQLVPTVAEPVTAVAEPATEVATPAVPEVPEAPAYLPQREPVLLPVPVPMPVEIAPSNPLPPPAAVEKKTATAGGRSAIAPLLALFKGRHRERRAALAPLTPLEVAGTPHHYTPEASLLEGASNYAEGA